MTETAAGDSGPVFRLIYRSRSRVGAAERKHQLGEIFSVARSSNKKLGVTGALLITDDEFVQTLEGAEPVVRELYAKISKDKRHEHLELLDSGDVSERVFGRWAMAKVAAEGEPDIPLLTNVDKGGISPAQPRPTTEAQEIVLDVMRQSLGSGDGPERRPVRVPPSSAPRARTCTPPGVLAPAAVERREVRRVPARIRPSVVATGRHLLILAVPRHGGIPARACRFEYCRDRSRVAAHH
jgi:Sensors of blue-light using FAD